MNRIFSTILAIVIINGGVCWGQNTPATSAAEAKLKEMVRSLTQRVTQAEQDVAKIQAEKSELDAKLKEKEEQIKQMSGSLKEKTEELTIQREQSMKTEATLKSELSEKSAQLKEYQVSLDKWKAAHAEITDIARKKERAREQEAAKAAALQRRVEDLRVRNQAMYETGQEILDRYKKFGYGEALLAREPFTGNMKVKLKNLAQEYYDALLDATPDSGRKPEVKKAEKFEPKKEDLLKEKKTP